MQLKDFKSAMGYNQQWDVFLDSSFYKQQLSAYVAAGSQDAEHYKWAAYLHILELHDITQKVVWEKFVALIDNDHNEHLFKGAISALLEQGKITREMLEGCRSAKISQLKKVQVFLASQK